MIVRVCAANRGDRDTDRRALAAINGHFARHTEAHKPPVLVVMSHVDQLRPAREWLPPYDIATAELGKARSIRDALLTVAAELECDVADIVPARLDAGALYNVNIVWAGILKSASKAQQVQLIRCSRTSEGASGWSYLLDQAATAGRSINRLVFAKSTVPSASGMP